MQDNPHLTKKIELVEKVLSKNDKEAIRVREFFDAHGILGLNFMSSPGSGKTTILEQLALKKSFRFNVIEGDLETENDANKLRKRGIEAVQIQTGSACHLDAFMISEAMQKLSFEEIEVCVIENIGNLVCPASYDVGTHYNIVLLSVTEGDDKVEKYPVMFKNADLILVSKCDLIEHFDFDPELVLQRAKKLNPHVEILQISSKSGEGIEALSSWICARRRKK
ncbi:hydrogenase nickel incorporation protein HypB [Helicobacter kayseriensis]|uniref:hydrogenase nickel incorporation protein HypB n=1 Tax=Helicobacter kayseriensis TaxID=2905877 RepID=UPI001E635655|nr:hydrogenase nickel incorporation protein HypB [Helicobacter kayseriensis]MCE3046832.1 hydrogenase nickel incorporation protein HypB [Helicobacter kayseriensis]MCE3047866.1 hydrogenase nickel incorporation protein HypB [Helicobacter kayseriensis]